VHNLSFNLEPNKITGLIGRNGAGKTTLLKIMAGYLLPSTGSIEVFSQNPFNNLNVSANMIFIDDNMELPQAMNLEELLNATETFYENWDKELAHRLFDYFSLSPRQYHQNLSKGMKSTFNMILGIAARCPLTIFDEPTIGMDAAVRKDFYRALLKDFMQHPRSIILSSHLLNEISDILDDILLIKDGEQYLHMSVDDLKVYAIGMQGKEDIITEITANTEVLYQKKLGKDSVYVAVRNQFSEEVLQSVRFRGVEISAVTADDLCVYLTAKNKGGIDDVFDRI
jgi:ABC-2 type transport system ATP-binding protein